MKVSLCVEPKIIYQNTSQPWDLCFRASSRSGLRRERRRGLGLEAASRVGEPGSSHHSTMVAETTSPISRFIFPFSMVTKLLIFDWIHGRLK